MIFIIIFIIFCCSGYKNLKKIIENVINKRFKENNIIYKDNNIVKSNKNQIKRKNTRNSENNKNKKQKNNQNSSLKELKSHKNNNSKNNKEIKDILNTTKDNKLENNQMKLLETDYELNNAMYKEAKKFDKRSGCEYYFSLLKYKQIFIFTFLNFNDYNSGVIKKFVFFYYSHYIIPLMHYFLQIQICIKYSKIMENII